LTKVTTRTVRTGAVDPAIPLTLEPVYRSHFSFVWRSLRRLGIAEADASDAAQDVFLIVHRRLADFDFAVPITTWLYAICMRVASDRRRSAHVRHEVFGETDGRECSGADAETTLELQRRRSVLATALDAMPMAQRAVFTLFELEEWSGERIAELLQVPLATVHSRLRLAREIFRTVVARQRTREAFLLRRLGMSHE
jgi:RNA polymerase sigma-70 factor, ECF subfamily